ncbi:MAG: hypothetical protein M1830_004888 [Pleopsidium flavum]|nr:MAG: hypothetical protein M1830_004888 [Pleopsidium flavum]
MDAGADYEIQSPVDRYDEHYSGKSPVERGDYEGLQLDTREKRGYDTHRGLTSSAKLKELEGLQASPTTSMGMPFRGFSEKPALMDDLVAQPKPKEYRICGMRRKTFWIFFGVILGIIIIAAIIGGAVGGTRNNLSASSTSPPPPPPLASLPPYDIMAASPIEALAFETNNSRSGGVQSFRLHYQSVNGNIKELKYDGMLSGWQNATPIFTDARNHTGLASYAYLNDTTLMATLIYQGTNGYLQEKRKNAAAVDTWEPGSLNSMNLQTNGSFSLQFNSSDANPGNDWDGFRIAAVYSREFPEGPGGRLYYHFTATNGSQWIQEIKWDQMNDTWTSGVALTGAAPNSHIAATIDEQHKAVRVFYCTGNETLQESWMNLSQWNSNYQSGIKIPNLLAKNDADITAVNVNGSTLIYYYSNVGSAGIRELNITGAPGSNSETSHNGTIVAEPALLSDGGAVSLYTPMTAALGQLPGMTPMIHVFYADNTVSTTSGYSRLSDISRPADNNTWPTSKYGSSDGQIQLPLGIESASPS